MKNIDFSSLEDALKFFEEAMVSPPKSELERDGVIQRFEYTVSFAGNLFGNFY